MQVADVIKYEGDNSTFVWKHPLEDFNSMTQLIVHESQEAVFMMNGEMEKRIHYSIAVVKLGKETKFTQILNMNKKLKQVLWAMRHIII